MRSRTSPDARATEVARRRLAALTAELVAARGAVPEPPPAVSQPAAAVPDGPASAPPEERETAPRETETGLRGGRHARRPVPAVRRAVDRAADLTPVAGRPLLASPPHLGSAQVGLVALVVALGLLLSAWWLVRATGDVPGQVAPPRVVSGSTTTASPGSPTMTPGPPSGLPATGSSATGSSATGSSAAGSPATGSSAGSGQSIVVDVVGKVRRPGIAVLPPGSRVVDAVEAAGGVRRGFDPATVNMARLLTDGEQVVVGRAQGADLAAAPAPGGDSPSGGLVSLNTADQATLETLPGVGPVTASAILEWRAEHGAFTSVDELLEVSGIGEATLAEIAPHVTL